MTLFILLLACALYFYLLSFTLPLAAAHFCLHFLCMDKPVTGWLVQNPTVSVTHTPAWDRCSLPGMMFCIFLPACNTPPLHLVEHVHTCLSNLSGKDGSPSPHPLPFSCCPYPHLPVSPVEMSLPLLLGVTDLPPLIVYYSYTTILLPPLHACLPAPFISVPGGK